MNTAFICIIFRVWDDAFGQLIHSGLSQSIQALLWSGKSDPRIGKNAAFTLPDTAVRELFTRQYQMTQALYHRGQPASANILAHAGAHCKVVVWYARFRERRGLAGPDPKMMVTFQYQDAFSGYFRGRWRGFCVYALGTHHPIVLEYS